MPLSLIVGSLIYGLKPVCFRLLKTFIRGTLLPPSDAYVRSFLYLLYTLIKLYYTHTQKKPSLIMKIEFKYSVWSDFTISTFLIKNVSKL